MMLSTVFLVSCLLSCDAATDADTAFGFTNFKIKLKSNHGVINRNLKQNKEVGEQHRSSRENVKEKIKLIPPPPHEELQVEENEISNEVVLPEPGGPFRYDPVRKVMVPMVFILNERIENPKFVSRKPKRQKLKTNAAKPLPIFNEIPVTLKPKPQPKKVKQQFKQKFENFKASGNHANILNTNFRFAYLKRIKQKMLSQNKEIVLSSGVHNENSRRPRKIQRVRRVRKKI